MSEHFAVAIVGSGPGGLSASVTAARRGLSHILLERTDHLADTIYRYQKGKKVMAHPMRQQLIGEIPFEAGARETVLSQWQTIAQASAVNVRFSSEVTAIAAAPGGFSITLAGGGTLSADQVVLAIGLQGNIRRLAVPGADKPLVRYQLDDPDEFHDKRITVVGAGDAGLENALALCGHNEVTIVNRQADLSKAKPGNVSEAERAIRSGRLLAYHNSNPYQIDDDGLILDTPDGQVRVAADIIVARLGAIPPRKFLESCGIRFPSQDPASIPELSETYESNVPGLYIIGALGGYTLIKQAINQGHELICRLAGDPTAPADEAMLLAIFAEVFPGESVAAALHYLRSQVPILAPLTSLQLRETMLECRLQRFAVGQIVFRRGDYTSSLWNIAEGAVEVELDPARPDRRIRIGAGEFVGELGLLSGRRRNATVIAAAPSVLVEIPVRAMRKLQCSIEAVQRELDRIGIRRLIHTTFGADRPIAELEPIIASASLRAHKAGACIVSEGAAIDALYILRSGSATVSRIRNGQPEVLNFINSGSLFGERGFLDEGGVRAATVRANVASEVVHIDADLVRAALADNPALRAAFLRAVQSQLESALRTVVAQSVPEKPANSATSIADFLISKGVGEATNVFIIDETICTRCGNCESACAATHGGISRVSRELGASGESILVPLACRHCETPHCMENCPVDAISRAPSGEVIIDQATCIGCEKCAQDCPYGVISMVDVGARTQRNWLVRMLAAVGLSGQNTTHGGASSVHETKALKCDLCRENGGVPACVTACPTGAAVRVEPETYMTWLREGRGQ
jgi:CRP-like cAMP-binding protein/Fe-S-cluster-containing hydrogenase component 2/thioredoxin reductase